MKKFLVVRFSSIGDIVLTTPVIRCLHKTFEGAEIHYLTKEKYGDLLAQHPQITKVFTIQKSIDEVLPQMREEGYDLVIDLHNNLRTGGLKMKLNAKYVAFSKLNIEKWVLVKFKKNLMPDLHVVDRYMDTLREWGVKNDGEGLDYYIPPEAEVAIESLPAAFHSGYMAFAIGGQHQGKKLPTDKLITICQQLQHPLVLLGGPEDKEAADHICAQASDRIYNGCGRYTLHQSASLIRQARVVLTHDTGLMHIASAFQKKIISLWGCTTPDLGMYPYLPHPDSVILQAEHLKKRPCSKLGNHCSYGDFRCAREIEDEAVIQAAQRLY
ncbi:MAG: glycosyltransferase family 9 protein [Salibacteraceae bacterium]